MSPCICVNNHDGAYLIEEALNVGFEGGAGLDDKLLGQHERVLALRLLRLDDVDEDDVEELKDLNVALVLDPSRRHLCSNDIPRWRRSRPR